MKKINFNRDSLISALFLIFIIGFILSICSNTEIKKTAQLIESKKSEKITLSEYIPYVREISEAFTDKNLQKGSYINPWGAIQKLLGNRYFRFPDGRHVVGLKNGYLVFDDYFTNNIRTENYKKWTDGMRRLKSFLDEKNIPLMYVQIPNKIDVTPEQNPIGFDNNINRFMDSTLSFADELGIDTMDLRAEFAAAGLDHFDLFFKTDHHWTPEAALQGTRILCKKLNKDYGYDIDLDLLSDQRMWKRTYSDIFLGSQGKRIGIYYTGVDDITVITPSYDTDFKCYFKTYAGKDFVREGNFEDAFIFRDRVETVNYFSKSPYTVYTGSDYAETRYVNNKIKDHKILFVRDSFCCTLAPFFSLAACNELYTIDPRADDKILSQRIEEINPDMVIFLNYVYFGKMNFFPE